MKPQFYRRTEATFRDPFYPTAELAKTYWTHADCAADELTAIGRQYRGYNQDAEDSARREYAVWRFALYAAGEV